jgi:hypothetical protein
MAQERWAVVHNITNPSCPPAVNQMPLTSSNAFLVSLFCFFRFSSSRSENQKEMAQPIPRPGAFGVTVTEAGNPKNETEQVLLLKKKKK